MNPNPPFDKNSPEYPPRTTAIMVEYYDKELRQCEDEDRDLWEPVAQLERDLAKANMQLEKVDAALDYIEVIERELAEANSWRARHSRDAAELGQRCEQYRQRIVALESSSAELPKDSPAAKNEGEAALRLLAELADAMNLSLGDTESVAKMRPHVLAHFEADLPSGVTPDQMTLDELRQAEADISAEIVKRHDMAARSPEQPVTCPRPMGGCEWPHCDCKVTRFPDRRSFPSSKLPRTQADVDGMSAVEVMKHAQEESADVTCDDPLYLLALRHAEELDRLRSAPYSWARRDAAASHERSNDERDAARYRWLRDGDKWHRTIRVMETDKKTGDRAIICDQYLDAAVDAAMQESSAKLTKEDKPCSNE